MRLAYLHFFYGSKIVDSTASVTETHPQLLEIGGKTKSEVLSAAIDAVVRMVGIQAGLGGNERTHDAKISTLRHPLSEKLLVVVQGPGWQMGWSQ